MAIGLVLIYSATFDAPINYWVRQMISAGVGALALVVIFFLPPKFWYAAAYPLYFISLTPLIYIIIFKAESVERWISLPGGIKFQPSELAKVALLLAMARLLAFKPLSLGRPKSLIAPFIMFIVPFLLVLKQPNLSTALSFVTMALVMAYWAGLGLKDIFLVTSPVVSVALTFNQLAWAGMFMLLIAVMWLGRSSFKQSLLFLFLNISAGYGAIFAWNRILYDHQRSRILTFMDPMLDPLGAGYQVLQSKVAIGSGKFFGKGLLNGTQTNLSFLPEEHTDFIFSVMGEQFGFFGCLVVLALYLVFLLRILRICVDVRSRFVNLVAVGAAGIFSFHIIVNVAMTIGLMPVTGLPLPFLSFGGSFLISCIIIIGILINLRARGQSV